MKRIHFSLIFIIVIISLLSACSDDTTLKQREIQITDKITRVYIEGPWEVVITQDSTNNSAILEYDVPEKKIKAEYFDSGILRIKVYSLDDDQGKVLRIKIAATSLLELEVCEGAKIETIGKFHPYSSIYLSGGSQLNGFWSEGVRTRLILSGASAVNNFTFIGNDFNAHIMDGSKVHLQNIQMNSSIECKVSLFNRSEFSASGDISGTPYFYGDQKSIFKTFDLNLYSLNVYFSGGVYAETSAKYSIKGEMEWGSKLYYKNRPDVSGVLVDDTSELIQVE